MLFFRQIDFKLKFILDLDLTACAKIHNIAITSQRPYRLEA